MTPEGRRLLREGCAALDVPMTPQAEEAFAHLLDLLQEGNRRHNLTALTLEADIVVKHFVDSASCLRGGHLEGALKVVDLGTGAGFPALPLAILRPALEVTPLDSTRKKINFVQATAQTLSLSNVTPVVGRAETLAREPVHRARYDRVVVRAVAALPVLVELALPLLREGGLLVAQKGQVGPGEVEAGRRAAAELGGSIMELDEFQLPISGDARMLVVIEKNRATPERYPRREGIPARQPLFWEAK